jgi:methylenetetrahydrofolate reductase (NADPH)
VRSRFEILPFGRGEAEAAELPEHVRLTVTASPTHSLDQTVEVGTRLRALGHEVTVHLAARMVRDREHLDELLAAMAAAEIDEAFVIGGDATPPHGPYASAVELLPIVHQHPQRPRTLGIGGYPEGHPLIDPVTLADALKQKSPLADYIATQLCFDAKALLGWVRTIRESGIELPVLVGLPGAVDRRRLLEVSMRVGVGPSLRYLRKQRLRNVFRLSGSSVDRLYDAIEPYLADRELNLAGFHYFTFNRLLETWRWQRAKHDTEGGVKTHAVRDDAVN